MHRYHGRANSIRPYNNPRNPLIPEIRDSKSYNEVKYKMEPIGEKTRSIASLRDKIVPTLGKFTGIISPEKILNP